MGHDVVELCTKSEHNRTIHSGVVAISILDLMTLNMFCCGIIFTQFELTQPNRS